MDRAALKTGVKRYGFKDNDPLDIWINAARNELVSDLPISVHDGEAAFATASGDGDLSNNLPADFLKVIDLSDITTLTDRVSLKPKDYRLFRKEIADWDEAGRPAIYTIRNLNQIKVWPIPNRATNWSMLYVKAVDQLDADVDVPTELPVQFHYVIIPRAAAIGLMAENEEERAQTAMNEYLTGKQVIINFFSQRQMGEFETVQEVMDYG